MSDVLEFIDGHQHFWQISRGDYSWLTPDLTAIFKDFLPEDLLQRLSVSGVGRTIAVQAAPSIAETDFLLSLADETDFIAGVVGWVDFEDPKAAVRQIETWSSHQKFVGVRPMIQDIEDDDWMLRATFNPVFEALIANDLTFDALVYPKHLRNLVLLAQRFGDLPIVVDHGAKPKIRNGIHGPDGYGDWAPDIAAVAACANVSCKISGLLTEAGPKAGLHDLKPYLDHLFEVFGEDRLIWGSDWPVLRLAGDYAGWNAMTRQWLAGLPGTAAQKIAATNADKFYRL